MKLEEKATNFDTYQHIHRVQVLLAKVITNLLERANNHDQSKLYSPEVELFTEYTHALANTTYGSKEYNDFKTKLKYSSITSDIEKHLYRLTEDIQDPEEQLIYKEGRCK
jgi:hypothetical protein